MMIKHKILQSILASQISDSTHFFIQNFNKCPPKTPAWFFLLMLVIESNKPDYEQSIKNFIYIFPLSNQEKQNILFTVKLYQMLTETEQFSKIEKCHIHAHPFFEEGVQCIAICLGEKSLIGQQEAFKIAHFQFIDRLMKKAPLVNGHILLREGISSGPEIGRLMKLAEEISIEKNIHSVEKILQELRPHY